MSLARETVAGLALRRDSETQLLERALTGDAVAFTEIHRRFSGRVFAFCLARLMSVHAAQDATQEVFLRLLSTDYDQVDSISGWLFGVARHVCIDIARSGQRTVPTESTEIEAAPASHSARVSAEDEAISKAQARDVFLALRRMRPRYRAVLVLRELHGQSMPEIADALAINVGTAYTLLSRARDAFGKTYSEALEIPGPCRAAVELVYRTAGSGISDSEARRLDVHLAQCARCSREARLAKERPLFSGLLPLMPGPWHAPRRLLADAMAKLGDAMPSLGSVAPAAPAASSWLPIAGAALAVTLLFGAAAAPSGSRVRSTTARSAAVRAATRTSAREPGAGDANRRGDTVDSLRAELSLSRLLRRGGHAATTGGARQAAGNGSGPSANGASSTPRSSVSPTRARKVGGAGASSGSALGAPETGDSGQPSVSKGGAGGGFSNGASGSSSHAVFEE